MADDGPSLVEPAEHLPAGATDRFGGRDACQRLELVVPRVDSEVRRERHQRVARAKDAGHPGNIRRERETGFLRRGSGSARKSCAYGWMWAAAAGRARVRAMQALRTSCAPRSLV